MAIFGGVARDVMLREQRLDDCIRKRMAAGVSEAEARAACESEAE